MRLTYSIADQQWERTKSIGIFTIAVGLARTLAEHPEVGQLTVLTNTTLAKSWAGNHRVRLIQQDTALHGRWGRLWWDHVGVYRAAKAAGEPWLLLPKGFAAGWSRCPVRLAVYVHDIIELVYPERYPGYNSRWRVAYYRWLYRQTLRRADIVFTNTGHSRDAIQQWAARQQIACPPIVVAGYGFDWSSAAHAAADARAAVEEQILVDVRAVPHKRTDLAVAYMERWRRERGYSGRICCAGELPPDVALPDDPAWVALGRVAPSVHLDWMARSRALVHFTELEGFGMPPVEAVLTGTPPVFSAIPVALEVMDGTGCPFDNADYEQFAAALDRALQVDPATCATWRSQLAARHSWTQVADRIVQGLSDSNYQQNPS